MQHHSYPGTFIVFEGLDGSGQSTQVRMLTEYLEGKGKQVLATKEPTSDSDAGRKIIEVLTHKATVAPDELQKLFVVDRGLHLQNFIIPALMDGSIVISDRYFLSTLAFGGISCDMEWLKQINSDFILPDVTFLLRTKPEVSLQRIAARGKAVELFEKLEKLEKVTVNYAKLAEEYESCKVIDGEQSIEDVHAAIIANLPPL